MKVFLSASPRGDRDFGKNYNHIYSLIEKLGFTQLDNEIITLSYEDFVTRMKRGSDAYKAHDQKKIQAIKNADICVFETSVHSSGIGFLIFLALESGKPTIVLHTEKHIPYFLSGIEDEKLLLCSYTNETLDKVLTAALVLAKERRDKRFNFFISPKLLEYLEKASNDEGVTKSKFIRNLIIAHMKK